MSKKQEFINYILDTIAFVEQLENPPAPMNEEAQSYWLALLEGTVKAEKPELTDNGKMILRFLQENTDKDMYKARDIADALCISSRGVSGSMRKLVTDNFVEKLGESPAIYSITEKGKNFIIEN